MNTETRFDIRSYPWDEGKGYRPESYATLRREDDGLHLKMRSRQDEPRAVMTGYGTLICTDDCLEFFLMPFPETGLYMNFETNANGIYHLGLGKGRHGRAVFGSPAENVTVTPVKEDGFWGVDVVFGREFFTTWFGGYPEGDMKGNFYKCGDRTEQPHWGMWVPYEGLPRPDFHRPERFAVISL